MTALAMDIFAPARFTLQEAAALAGVPQDVAHRLWRALGFALVPDGEAFFTDADVRALELARVRDERDLEAVLQRARLVGSALVRVAEMESDAIRRGATSADSAAVLLDHVHRRHLQAALDRRSEAALATTPLVAVGFVDLVGFTAISRTLEDDELADLLTRFESLAYEIVSGLGGRVVKTIGDEVMFVAEDPGASVRIGLDLALAHALDDKLPDVHVGMAHGSVLCRDGDYYGPVVNLARRIADISRPGAVVVSEALRLALQENPSFEWKPLGPRFLKDIGGVPLWLVRPAAPATGIDVLESLARGEIDVDLAMTLIDR